MAFKATQVVSNNFYDMMRKETLKGGKMVITSYIHRLDPSFKVCNSMLCSMYYCTRIKLSKNIFQIEVETLNLFKRRIKISGKGLLIKVGIKR